MATKTAPVRNTFLKLCGTPYVKSLLKEAKRVKYIIDKNGVASAGFKVLDPDHSNSLVFEDIEVRPGLWSVSFSKVYWEEPAN